MKKIILTLSLFSLSSAYSMELYHSYANPKVSDGLTDRIYCVIDKELMALHEKVYAQIEAGNKMDLDDKSIQEQIKTNKARELFHAKFKKFGQQQDEQDFSHITGGVLHHITVKEKEVPLDDKLYVKITAQDESEEVACSYGIGYLYDVYFDQKEMEEILGRISYIKKFITKAEYREAKKQDSDTQALANRFKKALKMVQDAKKP